MLLDGKPVPQMPVRCRRFCDSHSATATGRCWDHREEETWPPDDSPRLLLQALQLREAARAEAEAARQRAEEEKARALAAAKAAEADAQVQEHHHHQQQPPSASAEPGLDQPKLRKKGSTRVARPLSASTRRVRRPSLTVRSQTFRMQLPSPAKPTTPRLVSALSVHQPGGEVVPFQYPSREVVRTAAPGVQASAAAEYVTGHSVVCLCVMPSVCGVCCSCQPP